MSAPISIAIRSSSAWRAAVQLVAMMPVLWVGRAGYLEQLDKAIEVLDLYSMANILISPNAR